MAIKKSELYSSLWKSCDKLRGGMDASQYKDYILVLLFVKYVSDKYGREKYASIVIPKGGSFQDMVALKGKKDIGEGINKIIAKLTLFIIFWDDSKNRGERRGTGEREKNNNPLRSSASSAVNLFCHDPFIQKKLKSLLVVADKWMAAISGDVKTEMERISQRLARHIKELAERYATPMPAMNATVDELEMKVNGHLGKMGFEWN